VWFLAGIFVRHADSPLLILGMRDCESVAARVPCSGFCARPFRAVTTCDLLTGGIALSHSAAGASITREGVCAPLPGCCLLAGGCCKTC